MASRLKLHSILLKVIGNENVYFDPPTNKILSFPCIKYNRETIDIKRADNTVYMKRNKYNITVIGAYGTDDTVSELLQLPYCTCNREYTVNGLTHTVLTIFF